MTEKVICENGCHPTNDTPFVYGAFICNMVMEYEPPREEIGVLVYADGETTSNRFEDGTAGVPFELRAALDEYSELPSCVECGGQAIRVSKTRYDELVEQYDEDHDCQHPQIARERDE